MTTGDSASLGEWLVELGAHPPVAVWVIKKTAELPERSGPLQKWCPSLSNPHR